MGNSRACRTNCGNHWCDFCGDSIKAETLTLPRQDHNGNYFFNNGCIIQPAFNVPGKWVAFWPRSVPLRGDNDELSFFDSPEEVLAIFIDAGY